MAFFTVIIPLYNKERYILNAINSILNQTFTDFELLIINDCSTDTSAEIAAEFLSGRVRILHHEQNKGLSAARNTGIKQAKSDYITFLDADDLWKPDFLQTIYKLIHDFPDANIFATNYEENWNSKIYLPKNGHEILASDFRGYLDYFKIVKNEGIYNHGSVCFSKRVYDSVGLYNENIKLYEDLDFNIRANLNFKIAYSKKICMTYFMQTQNQLTRQKVDLNKLPNYSAYKLYEAQNLDFKKHLDLLRYLLVKKVKQDYNGKILNGVLQEIDFNNLNWKQKIVLFLPSFALNFISILKNKMTLTGYKITSI